MLVCALPPESLFGKSDKLQETYKHIAEHRPDKLEERRMGTHANIWKKAGVRFTCKEPPWRARADHSIRALPCTDKLQGSPY